MFTWLGVAMMVFIVVMTALGHTMGAVTPKTTGGVTPPTVRPPSVD